MAESFYFSHDYSTRSNKKIKNLIRKHGMIAYGAYWSIIEDLYMNANALHLDCEGIAFDLRVSVEIITSLIHDFDLFIISGEIFSCEGVKERLEKRNEKSEKAKNSALKRWNNANALPPQSESNAIKERKGKEIKENIVITTAVAEDKNILPSDLPPEEPKDPNQWLKDKKDILKSMIEPFVEKYGSKLCNDFWYYWGQPHKRLKQLKWEGEKYFDVDARLRTFKTNELNKK